MHDRYENPLCARYAGAEMQEIFSDDRKFSTWRRLWIALAEIEQELGLEITDEQIAELKAHADDINYEEARAREKIVRHDVMSHVYAYGLQCPSAKGIIHLGATSCYVTDNADLVLYNTCTVRENANNKVLLMLLRCIQGEILAFNPTSAKSNENTTIRAIHTTIMKMPIPLKYSPTDADCPPTSAMTMANVPMGESLMTKFVMRMITSWNDSNNSFTPFRLFV